MFNLSPLSDEDSEVVFSLFNILDGGITDPQMQALLIYRHLIHTGWLPPHIAEPLVVLKDNALHDLRLLRREIVD